ncbi:MAG: ATP synthase gamma chain [bacterium]|nr:MAG: ATP synthase gamma chain [bacterium]
MATLRDIKKRIQSVKNTMQITRAMKLVAAAKMRRAQEIVLASRPYASKMLEVLMSLAASTREEAHPLLAKRNEKNILILLCSSDKGLCGPFNANLFRAVTNLIRENEGKGIFMTAVGRKGNDFFKNKNVVMQKTYPDYFRNLGYPLAAGIGREMVEIFTQEKVDKIYLVYNHFVSVINQDVIVRSLLPIESPQQEEDGFDAETGANYLYEPSAETILSDILVKHVEVQVHQALLESWASENGARMAAMDNATRNAGEMIDTLTLQYNRARQTAITNELIEIVSGADALKV